MSRKQYIQGKAETELDASRIDNGKKYNMQMEIYKSKVLLVAVY